MKKINKKGLTLIELLAVIAIIAILFVLLIPQINSAVEKARISGVQTDLHSYQVAVQSYLMEHGDELPTAEQLNANLDSKLRFDAGGKSLVEKGPWGKSYVFLETTEDGTDSDGGVVTGTKNIEIYTHDKSDKKHSVKYVFENGQYVHEYYQYDDKKTY